jgi:acyl-CoA synthetase (AMP-forming)/AMP-acid ligase II
VARFTTAAWRALSSTGVTHALCVPTVLEMLLDAGALEFPSLRVLVYGGAPIHPETLRRMLVAVPHVRLLNMYGQTEGSPITCLDADDHRRIAEEGDDARLASVGRPLPGVELRVADPGDDGVGEVWARAEHLFLVDDDGWLRTGDLGRIGSGGELFLTGRLGDRIIRGGENVYPLEVERVIREHPGVRDVAVAGVPDVKWGEIVAAYVVPADGRVPPDPDELRAFARAQLGGFKVPERWTFVDALPVNAAGKVVRRLLGGGHATPCGIESPT